MKNAEESQSTFARLYAVDVSEHLEKKGPYAYLSWAYAVSELRKAEPTATWEVKRFEGLPYLVTECGYFVEVAVTVAGVTLSQIHPVLDGSNRPILSPNSFDINSSIQRALVKAIALHGLGLRVYAGEDLPSSDNQAEAQRAQAAVTAKRSTELRQVGSGISKAQQDHILRLIDETGADLQRLLDYFNVDSLGKLRSAQYPRVIRSLEHRRAA